MTELMIRDPQTGARARVLPDVGFNCFSFQVPINGIDVEVLDAEPGFEQADKRGTRSGIPWLFPFPNRIERGKFTWEGKSYELPVSDAFGNAIHGFVMDRPWRVIQSNEWTVTAEFQLSLDAPERLALWPADFKIAVTYKVRGTCLRADVHLVNVSDQRLPWGLGTHPYFKLPLSPVSQFSQCQIQVPAAEFWELHDCLPTARRLLVTPDRDLRNGAELQGLKLDDVLTGIAIEDGRVTTALLDPQAGLQITQVTDAAFRECVAFTPPGRSCVCIEPYTCVTNAINLEQQGIDAGWRVLEPGHEFLTWIEIHTGPILV